MFAVIISGDKNFKDYELLKEKCDRYLSNKIKNGEEIIIVSGGSNGSDKLGERYAEEKGYKLKQFKANWDKYGNRAGYLRNKNMTEFSNACIIFHDKEIDKGTKMLIRISREQKLLIREVNINNKVK